MFLQFKKGQILKKQSFVYRYPIAFILVTASSMTYFVVEPVIFLYTYSEKEIRERQFSSSLFQAYMKNDRNSKKRMERKAAELANKL